MLVLTRREGESLVIGEEIRVTVTAIGDENDLEVRIGLEVPEDGQLLRAEFPAPATRRQKFKNFLSFLTEHKLFRWPRF